MSAATRTRPGSKAAQRPSRRALRLARAGDEASRSPALENQSRLAELWSAGAELDMDAKWSPRRTLVFIALTCGGFWTVALLWVSRILR